MYCWIITAWQPISLKMAVRGFKKCCISRAVDETDDDDMLWNDGKEDGNVTSQCEENEGLDCDSDTDW